MNRSGNNHSASRLTCARTFGASGLILLLATGGLLSADSATHPRVEILVREIEPAAAAQVSYARQIRPIFASNCLDCHSAEEQKAGLDASSVPSLVKGGKKASPAILPGKPDESPLVQYLRGLREPQMPKGNPPGVS
jgi:mono/diheme cytochrome c family protein